MDKYMVECCRTCNDRVYRNDELTLSSTRVEEVQRNAIWGHGSPSIAWSSCATNGVYWCDRFLQFVQRQTSFQSKCPLRHLQRCVEQPDVQPHLTRSNKACGAAGRVIPPPPPPWLDFNGGMTRRIISTFRLAEPAIAMWARKRAPRVKSSAPYCSVVVGTPDVHR